MPRRYSVASRDCSSTGTPRRTSRPNTVNSTGAVDGEAALGGTSLAVHVPFARDSAVADDDDGDGDNGGAGDDCDDIATSAPALTPLIRADVTAAVDPKFCTKNCDSHTPHRKRGRHASSDSGMGTPNQTNVDPKTKCVVAHPTRASLGRRLTTVTYHEPFIHLCGLALQLQVREQVQVRIHPTAIVWHVHPTRVVLKRHTTPSSLAKRLHRQRSSHSKLHPDMRK